MTYTPEYKILRDYVKTRQQILQKYPAESSKAKDDIKELKELYAKLLRNQRLRFESNDSNTLKVMQKRLEDIFNMLSLWQRYVDVIYASESEITALKAMKDNGLYNADPDELNFAAKLEKETTDKKLAELFAPSNEGDLDKQFDDILKD